MRLLQFYRNREAHLGVITDNGILDVAAATEKFLESAPVTMEELIDLGDTGIGKLADLVSRTSRGDHSDCFLQEDRIVYAPVVTNPEKILCVGLNYIDHAKESNMNIPDSPVLFSKFNNTLTAHQGLTVLPHDAKHIDYEAELVIVIGKTAKNISKQEALSYVFGYTIGNDLSARDLQFRSGQWLLGKSPDGFAPVGPYIVTSEEIDPNHLSISCTVNGEIRQQANTEDMIFNCATLISYISQYMTLKPGDLIFTGTPEGVILGYPEKEQVWLQSGDQIVVSIESLGELKTTLK